MMSGSILTPSPARRGGHAPVNRTVSMHRARVAFLTAASLTRGRSGGDMRVIVREAGVVVKQNSNGWAARLFSRDARAERVGPDALRSRVAAKHRANRLRLTSACPTNGA